MFSNISGQQFLLLFAGFVVILLNHRDLLPEGNRADYYGKDYYGK